ncbi:hypothetical protein V1J52_22950 [Streptomyces sp. TRM 70351]|uniref:hypothetical protein n=1 Tax=Streptomyces sp. TRM 70351 TaxID=3116552 RepID=UPI002E7B3474|nr:hypothetical protein [Streptomyces sp. TRM 70351]MEE1931001.1 hypothetical protein [Streptomyces sp. TRM 70351]
MSDHRARDGVRVSSSGSGSPAIGRIERIGQLIVSPFVGDVSEFTGRVKSWSGWNWPPFFLVLALGATALITGPDGPAHQFLWVYAVIGAAVVLSLCRVMGLAGAVSAQGGGRAGPWQALVTGSSLLLAVLGLVGMDHYADHGDVDVTGPALIIPEGPATNGSTLTVAVDNQPHRTHLRLALAIEDAERGRQSCSPETTYSARLAGSGVEHAAELRSGELFSLPLGGARDAVRVLVTLATDEGCWMSVSVAEAVLHD